MIKTINPYTNEIISSYSLYSEEELNKILNKADSCFNKWSRIPIKERGILMKHLADELDNQKQELSKLISLEMGKPINQSLAEIEKCIMLCDFYIENAEQFLSDQLIKTEASQSFISYDPMGCILAVMPWNYPFWQVMRFAVPTIMAGNTAVLKHASNVSGCALKLQELFDSSGFPKGCFNTVICNHDQLEQLIEHPIIKAVTLTGSEKAGRKIAEIAGRNLKKTVLELGGNNACIILKDANLDKHLNTIVNARMQNTGQSCIAAKRFIVVKEIYDEFLERFEKAVRELKSGDPMEDTTEISVLARKDLAETLRDQVNKSIDKGAKVLYGNDTKDAYYSPTIITEVSKDMEVFKDETFGPVAAVIKVKNEDEAYKMAGESKFGLGTMIFTENTENAYKRTGDIADGAYFVNELVKSDPRLPFGGTKASGYGRELSKEGILEFVNKKTVYITK